IGAAVVDDVLGIVELGVLVSLAGRQGFTFMEAASSGIRAVVAFVALTGLGLLIIPRVVRSRLRFRTEGAAVGLAVGSALVAAYVMAQVGLALILGAYAV